MCRRGHLRALKLLHVHQSKTVCCDRKVISYILNISTSLYTHSLVYAFTVCAELTTVARNATLTHTAINRVSLEGALSALHTDATDNSCTCWWSVSLQSYRKAHVHLRCNLLTNSRPYCSRSHQRHTVNLMWYLAFRFIRSARQIQPKFLCKYFTISHVYQNKNEWLHTCVRSIASTTINKKINKKLKIHPFSFNFAYCMYTHYYG